MVTRRELLIGVAALSGGAATSFVSGGAYRLEARERLARPIASGTKSLAFELAERPTALPCFGGRALPLWTFQEGTNFPIIRLKLGQRLDVSVKNSLPRSGEYASIHWHGLRIPNGEDGVPFMTQAPIDPGGEGHYSFVPPDTGSFFFHTHCNSAEQIGRGLFGALIVEGDEIETADAEYVLLMKDWRLSPEGTFLPFSTDDGAARAGSAGTIRSINGETKPVIEVPASANVRLRLYNIDPTRISEIGFQGADAAIIAIDGNGIKPIPLESWRMGPAMRLDILLRTAPSGGTIALMDFFAKSPVALAEFTSKGPPRRRGKFRAAPLKVMPFPKLDEKRAEHVAFEFSATATGAAVAAQSATGIEIGTLCLSKRTFWAINKQAWPGMDHRELGPPLAVLRSGQSYVFELKNSTPHSHPIHIHGHTFEVLSSSLRRLPRFRADTVMLLPNERIEIGLVAGEPGKWMFHCHILEHQETGMMGYISVT